jgi:hypothetical protein
MCESLGQLILLALVLTGLLNPTDITLADSETLRFPNDSLVTFTMLVQGSISALFAISLVRQDIAESQLMAPWWLKILRMPYDILWALISKPILLLILILRTLLSPLLALVDRIVAWPLKQIYLRLFPPLRTPSPQVRPDSSTIEPPIPPPTPSGMESWARDKFTTRRHLYVLERQLVEEVQWDAKSSRAGLLESSIHDALNRSHHLLLDEEQELYETWYDDQTALDAINDDIQTEQRRLGALQSRLQLLREKNNLSLAKLEIQGRKQAVPHSISKARQEIEYHMTAVAHDIACDKDLLLDLEMKLLDAGVLP